MVNEKNFNSITINKICQRIRSNIKSLGKITVKHVLRNQNKETDNYANKAIERLVGIVKENNKVYYVNIP